MNVKPLLLVLLFLTSVTTYAQRVDVKQFGAVGDGTTDDSAAVSSALDAAASVDGPSGTLYFPKGKYRIASPIDKSLMNQQSQLIIEGEGSSSQILINVGPTDTGIKLSAGYNVLLRNLVFVGPDDRASVGRALSFVDVLNARVQNCHFYNIHSTQMDWGGVLYAEKSRLFVKGCSFSACSGNNLRSTGNITLQYWKELHAEDLEFIDFAVLNGHYVTIVTSPDGWIVLGNVYPPTNSYTGGFATITNVVSDEGAISQLKAYTTDGSQIQNLSVKSWRANSGSGKGFWLNGIKRATIEDSQVAYQPAVIADGFEAVLATNVDYLDVNNSQFLYNSNAITLGQGVRVARIRNSDYRYLNNPGHALIDEINNGAQNVLRIKASPEPERSSPGAASLYLDEQTGQIRISINGSPFFDLPGGTATQTLLEDQFASTTIDANKWRYVQTGQGTVTGSQVNGALQFQATACYPCDDSAYYESVNSFDMTQEGIISVQLLSHLAVEPGRPYFSESLEVWQSGQLYYMMRLDKYGLLLTDAAGSNTTAGEPYWRIRYQQGTIKYETSTDGQTWNVRRSSQPAGTPTNVKVRLHVRAAFNESISGVTRFDNFKFINFRQ